MTRKEAQRRLAAALHEQRAAQEDVREANARVVEATSRLPPHYVDEHRRFASGEHAQIQKLIDAAQKASDRSAIANADVVNLRSLVSIPQAQKTSSGRRHATKKKSLAQLDREIAEWQAARSGLSKHHKDLLSRRKPGGGLRAGDLTPAGWHGDPMAIEDRKLRLEALREQPAPRFPKDPGRSHATKKTARSKPVSKPGPHGTLYRYSIVYTDQGDSGFGEATWNTWAYDPQHAVDRFYESPDGDTGWVALRIARQQESPAHRWTWHSLGR